jgi:hypothetical protein
VPHERLILKLEYHGIRGATLQWIRDFLEGSIQQVLLEDTNSATAPVQSGVPQGSVLGHLLFLLFINDLPDYISTNLTVRLFADDCALYRTIKDNDDAISLQNDLDELRKWEKEWMMEFHPEKCQILHFTNKTKIINILYTIHGHVLEVTDTTKYLRINLQKNMKWNNHINGVTRKVNSTIAFLRMNLHQCPPENQSSLLQDSSKTGLRVWKYHMGPPHPGQYK